MQDGSRQIKQGITLATNNFSETECLFLAQILKNKFSLSTSVIKSGFENQ
jgi:LAGLIDADG DNA endonuclease family